MVRSATPRTAHPRRRPRRVHEKRDPKATRQALLRAAAHLFPARGYNGVSVEDLATRAGVNKALISYHFGGKRGLYVAVLEAAFADLAERLKAIESHATDAGDGLRRFFEAFATVLHERPEVPALFVREAVSTGIEPAVVPHLLEIIGITRRLAERGRREGLFRVVDPLLLHFGVVGALSFFFATEPARRRLETEKRVPFEMPSADDFVRHVQEMTLRGLAPGPFPAPGTRKTKGARS